MFRALCSCGTSTIVSHWEEIAAMRSAGVDELDPHVVWIMSQMAAMYDQAAVAYDKSLVSGPKVSLTAARADKEGARRKPKLD